MNKPAGSRRVTLVLADGDGNLGQLAPFVLQRPWLQEVDEIVTRVRAEYGAEVHVLRLLTTLRTRSSACS